MALALDVAKTLVLLASNEEEPEYLTHMQLQKLLYYVQGWSQALRGKPMFGERIEAWAHGPVVRDVYPHFADFGKLPIPPDKVPAVGTSVDEDDLELIGSVWEVYKGFTAAGLRAKTHSEKPWIEARGKLDPAARCDTEITRESIQAFFATLVKN